MKITANIVRTVDKYATKHTRYHSTYEQIISNDETVVISYDIKVHGHRRKEVCDMIKKIAGTCDIATSSDDAENHEYHCICEAYTDILLMLGFRGLGIFNNNETWHLADHAIIYALLAKGTDMWNITELRRLSAL